MIFAVQVDDLHNTGDVEMIEFEIRHGIRLQISDSHSSPASGQKEAASPRVKFEQQRCKMERRLELDRL
jgi:hypothetical protein